MIHRLMPAALVLALAAAAAGPVPSEPEPPAPARSAARCLYIPPAIEDRVLFYHSFEGGPARPDVNRLAGRFSAGDAAPAQGIAGHGAAFVGEKRKRGLALSGLALPLHKPVTFLMWWRLHGALAGDSAYHLVSLRGEGYISNFVRSGPWCALTEPTFVVQVYRWPGISNVNGIRFGTGMVGEGVWHHVALVVARGSNVRVYWDGALRSEVNLKGRTFTPHDVVTDIGFGPQGLGHPMSVDEVMILDVALSGDAVRDYLAAVRQLAAAGFPSAVPTE